MSDRIDLRGIPSSGPLGTLALLGWALEWLGLVAAVAKGWL